LNILQFRNASSFRQNISSWNVSGVSSMSYLFADAVRFIGNVSMWDVSNVYEFTFAFSGCSEFNGNLSSWNTASALYMDGMFSGAAKFRGEGLSYWDTSTVLYFDSMFKDAVSFISDLSSWDVSMVSSMNSMVGIFCRQCLHSIFSWLKLMLTFLFFQFDGAASFNSDISQWNVSSVMDASYMFFGAASFNYSLCPWSNILPSSVLLDRIFIESGCDDTSDPTVNGTFFCGSCIE
jgi:surface protein